MSNVFKAPFSAAAAIACASIGAHFLERAERANDAWTKRALYICVTVTGLLTVAETLEVWQQLGFAKE